MLEKDQHVVIKNAPSNLYNMLEKAHDDAICSQNKTYNIGQDEDVTQDMSEIPYLLIDSGINHNTYRREQMFNYIYLWFNYVHY